MYSHFTITTVKVMNISIRPSSFSCCLWFLTPGPYLPPYLQTSLSLLSVSRLVCIFWSCMWLKSYNVFILWGRECAFFTKHNGNLILRFIHVSRVHCFLLLSTKLSTVWIFQTQVVDLFTCRKTFKLLAALGYYRYNFVHLVLVLFFFFF